MVKYTFDKSRFSVRVAEESIYKTIVLKRIGWVAESGKLETYLIIMITSVQIGYSLFTG